MNFKKYLSKTILNIPAWHTNRKIIVIESDDWGSIRMSSIKAYKALVDAGIPVDKDVYCKYDSLESNDDLTALFDVLKMVTDKSGKHPVITANTIVANPDFEKIRSGNFETYYYELFTNTLNRYSKEFNAFETWKHGISEGLFFPQFHGREHVNVSMWMHSLQNKEANFLKAFDHGVFGINKAGNGKRNNYMAAFDYNSKDQIEIIKKIFLDGLQIFNQLFHYKSDTFIAPCYIWSEEIEQIANVQGVNGIQGIPYQYLPTLNKKNYDRKIHFTGNKNRSGQTYLVRNVFFEPTIDGDKFSMQRILKRIETAFFWKKPAIISSHRINFIGGLVEENRTKNLIYLKELLAAILKNWPDVEFLSSAMLAETIKKD